MTEVLRQKLAATRAPKRPAGVSVEALLRKTMPRDADAAVSLDISVTGFQSASEDKPTLLESLAPTDLVYLVQSAEGARGIVRLDKGLVSALIEVQMSGRVAPSPP
ncbi:MAG: hypothetical protein LJE62_17400, partial [Silicimonas sp.]|nr:hypothetical protein [Silicimonas sp.]